MYYITHDTSNLGHCSNQLSLRAQLAGRQHVVPNEAFLSEELKATDHLYPDTYS